MTLFGAFYDVILPIDRVSLTLDGVTSFMRIINVRNTCKRLRYSQNCGAIKTVAGFIQCNGGKLKESERYNFLFIGSCVLESKKISSRA